MQITGTYFDKSRGSGMSVYARQVQSAGLFKIYITCVDLLHRSLSISTSTGSLHSYVRAERISAYYSLSGGISRNIERLPVKLERVIDHLLAS